MQASVDTGRIHRTRTSRSTSAENTERTTEILQSKHWWGKHIVLQRGWRQRHRYLCHALRNPLEPVRAIDSTAWRTVLAEINVALRDVLKLSRNPLASSPKKLGWNNTSGQRKRSVPTVMLFSVWEYVGRLFVWTFRGRFYLCVVIKRMWQNVSMTTRTTSLSAVVVKEYRARCGPHILYKFTDSQIKTEDGARQSVTFASGHCVRYTVIRIQHNAGRPSRSVQRQDRLGRHVRGGHVERLKHGQSHVLSVCCGVQNIRERNGKPFRRQPELVVESVMQDFLHVALIRFPLNELTSRGSVRSLRTFENLEEREAEITNIAWTQKEKDTALARCRIGQRACRTKKSVLSLSAVTDEEGHPLDNEDESGRRLCEYWWNIFQARVEGPRHQPDQFVTISCTTRVPSIFILPWAGGSATIVVGACDPRGHPLGFAPRSPRHEGGNAHMSSMHGISSWPFLPLLLHKWGCNVPACVWFDLSWMQLVLCWNRRLSPCSSLLSVDPSSELIQVDVLFELAEIVLVERPCELEVDRISQLLVPPLLAPAWLEKPPVYSRLSVWRRSSGFVSNFNVSVWVNGADASLLLANNSASSLRLWSGFLFSLCGFSFLCGDLEQSFARLCGSTTADTSSADGDARTGCSGTWSGPLLSSGAIRILIRFSRKLLGSHWLNSWYRWRLWHLCVGMYSTHFSACFSCQDHQTTQSRRNAHPRRFHLRILVGPFGTRCKIGVKAVKKTATSVLFWHKLKKKLKNLCLEHFTISHVTPSTRKRCLFMGVQSTVHTSRLLLVNCHCAHAKSTTGTLLETEKYHCQGRLVVNVIRGFDHFSDRTLSFFSCWRQCEIHEVEIHQNE